MCFDTVGTAVLKEVLGNFVASARAQTQYKELGPQRGGVSLAEPCPMVPVDGIIGTMLL